MITKEPEHNGKHKRRNLNFNRILRIIFILIAAITAGSALNITISMIINNGGAVTVGEKGNRDSVNHTAPDNTSQRKTRSGANTSPSAYKPKNACSGDEFCEACKNCKDCKNCNEYGGTCRMCSNK